MAENIAKNKSEKETKTILVTGGLGFIGGHFIELLLRKGYTVINVDKVTYAANPALNDYFSHAYPGKYRFIKKDINDLEELPFCSYITHFAAESHVDNAIVDGNIFVKSNVLGTQNLLNLLIKAKGINLSRAWEVDLPVFVYISTDEVFGDIEDGFFREKDRYNPSNPYSASKAAAELLVMAYGRTYGLPYKITRTTNNYGPRQHREKLVSHCIASLLQKRKIKIHGSGEQIRNWIHVEDNCRAIYDVMMQGTMGETYHVSSPEEYSVNQIVQMILTKFNLPFTAETVEYIQDRSGQDKRYALESLKIKTLGWFPKHTFLGAIDTIIKSYEFRT